MSNVENLAIHRHPEKAGNPENPLLRKPDWIRVKAPTSKTYGETRRLMFEVSGDHLGRFERNGRFVVQPGPYDLALGLSEQQTRPTSVAVLPTLAETMTRAMAAGPLPALFDRLRDTG